MDVWNTIAVFCMVAFSIVLLFRLGTIPTVFIDEGNGMYDSWSLAKYGVDSNLISNPIYLQSFAGQGQSILYARLAGTFLKILGYSIYVKSKAIFLTTMIFCTSPWLIMVSRFGMDCNVAPFMVLIGTLLLLLSTRLRVGGY